MFYTADTGPKLGLGSQTMPQSSIKQAIVLQNRLYSCKFKTLYVERISSVFCYAFLTINFINLI